MTFSFPLVLDMVLALLLAVMIWYSVILNRRLNKFRGNRDQMEKLATTFNEATTRATASIGDLKIASDALQDQLAKAESLRDDLVFLVDRGTIAADRLEDNVRVARDSGGNGMNGLVESVGPLEKVAPIRSRKAAKAHPPHAKGELRAAPAEDPREMAHPMPRSEAERALLKAIRSAS
ncbi:MAG: DUF6468 domain-containing protein [Rhodospirillaceae bacterium]